MTSEAAAKIFALPVLVGIIGGISWGFWWIGEFIFGIDSNLGWACIGFLAGSVTSSFFHYTDSLRKRVEEDLTR